MIDVASPALPFGNLVIDEVLSFYEFPRLYSLHAELYPEMRLLAICVEEGDDGRSARFLYAAMSTERLSMVRSGGLDLAEAFRLASHGQLWEVNRAADASGSDIVAARAIDPAALPPEDLPIPGARLNLVTPTAPTFAPDEDVVERSRRLGAHSVCRTTTSW